MTIPNEPLTTTISPDGYVLMTLSGGLNNSVVNQLKTACDIGIELTKEHFTTTGGKIKVLFDMVNFTGEYSIAALETIVVLAKETDQYVLKAACFGGPEVGKVAGEVVAFLSHRKNIKFYKTREEALAWLNDSNKPEGPSASLIPGNAE